jgi:hypothetical protein
VEIVRREVAPGIMLPFARKWGTEPGHGDPAQLEVTTVTA